jgi:predicted MPP superfamily phosphohydrolase
MISEKQKQMNKTLKYMRIALLIAAFLAIVFLANVIVYLATVASWPVSVLVPDLALKLILAAMSMGSVSILILSSRYNNQLTRALYAFFSLWMGLFVYLFIGSFVLGAVFGMSDLIGAKDSLAWLGQTLGILSVLTVIYGLLNAYPIRRNHISLTLANLPGSWKGKRAVFVSDMHLGQIHTERFASRAAETIGAVNPDIIFIGGDLYDGVKVDESAIIAPLASLKPTHGIYFITGNHEEFSDSAHFLNAIRALGIRVLTNEMVDVEGLQVIGVTDHDSIDKDKLTAILASLPIDRSRASILLKHQPSYLDIPERAGVSIQMSGHTHRAQLFPLNVLPYWIFKGYSYGLKKFGNMQVYTSSGVGSWGPAMRVGSESEIAVIEFV